MVDPAATQTVTIAKPRKRNDVHRCVRLPKEIDQQLRLLIEQRGSNFNRELKEAVLAHLAVHI